MFALQVVSEEKEGKQERRWESVEHGRKQQATQRHNQVQGFGLSYGFSASCVLKPSDCIVPSPSLQDEGGEMMGGGSDGATGIGNCWPQLQTPHCGTERQVHICVLIVFS